MAPIWFAFGAILGPIALLLLRAAPPGRCRSCGTPTRAWLRVCGWCGEDVASTPATTLAIVARMSGPTEVGEVSRDRPLSKPVEPSRRSTTSRPRSASRPVAARPQLVPERKGSHARKGSPAVQASKRVANGEPDVVATRVLATAVYVTGNKRLEPGRRYGIAVHGSRLQILGPIELDPLAIVLERPAGEIDASEAGGRLIISEPRSRSGLVLAFMSMAGSTKDDLAEMIRDAARESIQP